MFQHTADELYSIVTGSSSSDYKYDAITNFKAHIKREFVDLGQLQRYFEALKAGNKSSDFKVSSVSFSSICHLIKRVGMQDPNALSGPVKIILPILVNRLLDPKPLFQNQAKKSLETYWLATPSIVEGYIRDSALIHSNGRVRAESIMFLSDLIELNKNFNFQTFLPNVINLLRDSVTDVGKNAEVLLLKYYTLNISKIAELSKELKSQKIEHKHAVKLLREIDVTTANAFSADMRSSVQAKSTIDTFNNLSTRQVKKSASTTSASVQSQRPALADFSDILGGVPTAQLDDLLRPVNVFSVSDLNREVELLLKPFSGKETEFNWNNREKNIIRFRGLVVGNADRFPDELVAATRSMLDGIDKSVLSLRTTLSSNGCQLIKEVASYLGRSIDPVSEKLFDSLAALTSATKKIASLNAFGSICVLLMNTSFNTRLFNQCYNLFLDKNVQPRLYSSTFMRIYVQKHSSRLDSAHMDTILKLLSKGVADPNTTVRESMRTTFWIFYKSFPDVAEGILLKQDISVKKALERSRPASIEPSSSAHPVAKSSSILPFERKRPSVKEFMAAKKLDSRSTSNTQLSVPTSTILHGETAQPADLGKPARIGMPQRVRVSSAGDSRPLERQISKGRTEEKTKWATASRDNTTELPKIVSDHSITDPEIDVMLKCIKSPLTRERVQGIEILRAQILSKKDLPSLTGALNHLIILDALLLKSLLELPDFFDLVDLTLSIKVLAVNKMDMDVLIERSGNIECCKAIISLVSSLESLQFDNAPSTMFHIKYKTVLLDYSVRNLYQIASSGAVFESAEISGMASAMFPLSISDYPKYDELIVQLHQLDMESFEAVLSTSNAYVQSKIKMILDDFKGEDKIVENTIPMELTMINAFNPNTLTRLQSETPEEIVEQSERKNDVDYMSDIFSGKNSKEPTRDFTFVGPGNELQRQIERMDSEMEIDSSPEPLARIPILKHEEPARTASPFMDDPNENDETVEKMEMDEATQTMTVQLNQVHISPEKFDAAPAKKFNAPDRSSLSEIITKSDPIFNRGKKSIHIFEDVNPIQPVERKLSDLELTRVQKMTDEDVTISRLLELANCFKDDNVNTKAMNSTIKVLQQSVNNGEVVSWMKDTGFKTIFSSVIHYFHVSANITKDLCFKGLIVLKELFIISEFLDGVMDISEMLQVWNILIMVVENLKDFKNSIYISVDELSDDLICLNIPGNKSEVLKNCCLSLKESTHLVLTSFLLSSLSKCIEYDVITLEQIKEIDNTIFNFLSDDRVEVRRLTIITYSKCKRKLQHINSNKQDKLRFEVLDDAEHTYKDVFDKLSLPQRKLVDYYCEN